MKKIDVTLFHEESFIENQIQKFNLNSKNKQISIVTNGGYFGDTKGTVFSKILINIKNWDSLQVFERRTKDIKEISEYPEDLLRSIMEFHYDGSKLRLVDVGYNCWIDWVFTNPKVTIYGEIDESYSSDDG